MIIPGALIRRKIAGGGGPGPGPDPEVTVLRASTIVITRQYTGQKDTVIVPLTLLTAVRGTPAASITPKAVVPHMGVSAVKSQDRASTIPKANAPHIGVNVVRTYTPTVQSFTISRARVIVIS